MGTDKLIPLGVLACAAAMMPNLAIAASVEPATPILGTWKMDTPATLKESHSSPNAPPPKSLTESYSQLPSGQIQLDVVMVSPDDSEQHIVLVYPSSGGEVQEMSHVYPAGRTAVQSMISPNEWVSTQMMNGAQQDTIHKLISPDGKTMREIVRFRDNDGKWTQYVRVMRRQ